MDSTMASPSCASEAPWSTQIVASAGCQRQRKTQSPSLGAAKLMLIRPRPSVLASWAARSVSCKRSRHSPLCFGANEIPMLASRRNRVPVTVTGLCSRSISSSAIRFAL